MSLSAGRSELKAEQKADAKAILNQLIQDVIDSKPLAEITFSTMLIRNKAKTKSASAEELVILAQWYEKIQKEVKEAAEAKTTLSAGKYLFLHHMQEDHYDEIPAALENLRKSAELGHPGAKVILGSMLLNGHPSYPNLIKDSDKGYRLLQAAAIAGHPSASFVLGVRWQQQGDYEKTARLYQQAIDANPDLEVVRYFLATLCEQGLGTPKSLVRAVELYRHSTEISLARLRLIELFEKHYPAPPLTVTGYLYQFFTPPKPIDDPAALYHIVLALVDLPSTPAALKTRLINAFQQMAQQNPLVIIKQKDAWDKVKLLLTPEIIGQIERLRAEESKEQGVAVVSALFTHGKHLADSKKPMSELLEEVMKEKPGAYIPFEMRLERKISDDLVMLVQQFTTLLGEEKEKKELTPSKYYLVAKLNEVIFNNKSDALPYYRKAAEKGHPGAQFTLGKAYSYHDDYTLPTIQKTFAYLPPELQKAADQGDYRAHFECAKIKFKTKIIINNDSLRESEKLFRKGTAVGYPPAWHLLAGAYCRFFELHESEETTNRNQWLAKAAFCLRKAGDGNYEPAIKSILSASSASYRYLCRDIAEQTYHFTLALSEWNLRAKKITPIPSDLHKAFCELAEKKPEEFMNLAREEWDKVVPLLPASVIREKLEPLRSPQSARVAPPVEAKEEAAPARRKPSSDAPVSAFTFMQQRSTLTIPLLSPAEREASVAPVQRLG